MSDSLPRKFYWHDFRRSNWYHITISAARRPCSLFARLQGEESIPTVLGRVVLEKWNELTSRSDGLLVTHKVVLMPDHIHALVHVLSELPKPLGVYIGIFKGVTSHIAHKQGISVPLWESGFVWRTLDGSLERNRIRKYIKDNPPIAAAKRRMHGFCATFTHPALPQNETWNAFGNISLLDAPVKIALRVSRTISATAFAELEKSVRTQVARGAVFVSPFVSPGEQHLLKILLAANCCAIILPFSPINKWWKPHSSLVTACEEGRLLFLSAFEDNCHVKIQMDKPQCEKLNTFAREIATPEPGR